MYGYLSTATLLIFGTRLRQDASVRMCGWRAWESDDGDQDQGALDANSTVVSLFLPAASGNESRLSFPISH